MNNTGGMEDLGVPRVKASQTWQHVLADWKLRITDPLVSRCVNRKHSPQFDMHTLQVKTNLLFTRKFKCRSYIKAKTEITDYWELNIVKYILNLSTLS